MTASGPGTNGLAAATVSSSVALTPDGGMLVVANDDSGSVSLLDTATLEVLAEIPVGRAPRAVAVNAAGTRAFVTIGADHRLVVVDLARWRVKARRMVGREPAGVLVTAKGQVFVAAQGAGTVAAYDARTLAPLGQVETEPSPSALALSRDGQVVFVTHASTGRVSVLDADALDVQRVISVLADAGLAGSLAIDDDAGLAYLPLTRANVANPALLFDTTLLPVVSVVDLAAGVERVEQRIAIDLADRPVSRPAAALLAGGRLWVLHAGSGDLSVIDLESRRAVAHLDVGENPTGLALSPDGATVYAHAALDGAVRVVDVPSAAVRRRVTVTRSPVPRQVRRGKVLFHTSRPTTIARDRWISCAACHPGGKSDGRTWSFPDGPRNTPSLLGVGDTLPAHWSGDLDELQDVEETVRGLQAGTGLATGADNCDPACDQAPPNAGRSRSLDDLAAYLRSLRPALSPDLVDGRLSAEAKRGRVVFRRPDTRCASCHPAPLYTDRRRHDVGTGVGPGERKGPRFDTPSLRTLYESAPYLHDGRAPTLEGVLTVHNAGDRHGRTSHLEAADLADLAAFLRSLPFEDSTSAGAAAPAHATTAGQQPR